MMRARLDDDRAKQLLARAIEIQAARGAGLTMDDVRAIAADLEIEPGVLDEAERQMNQGAAASQAGSRTSVLEGLGYTAAGIACGIVARLASPSGGGVDWAGIASVAGLSALSIYLVRLVPRARATGHTVILLASVWGGFLGGFLAAHGSMWGDVAGIPIIGFAAAAIASLFRGLRGER